MQLRRKGIHCRIIEIAIAFFIAPEINEPGISQQIVAEICDLARQELVRLSSAQGRWAYPGFVDGLLVVSGTSA